MPILFWIAMVAILCGAMRMDQFHACGGSSRNGAAK